MRDVRLAAQPFDPGALANGFARAMPGHGGLASFLGSVREDGAVEALELLAYERMTLPGMERLADAALARFTLQGILIVHRHGVMRPGDPIVFVAAAARHRREAIEAVDYAMDHLKSDSWFWKRELRGGTWQWIEPREQDHADLARWG